MKKTIKIYDLNHALDCVWEDNLLIEFEKEFGVLAVGTSMNDLVVKNNITVEQVVDFLNQNSSDRYELHDGEGNEI